jgi:hypothetical protein
MLYVVVVADEQSGEQLSIYRSRLGSLIGKSATAARLRLGGWGDKMFDCWLGKLDLSSVFFFLHRRAWIV